MGDRENKKSFWTTLPGILTGCAAVITAIGGLITVIIVSGPTQEPPPPPAPKPVINSFTASPSSISAGENCTLRWSVSDAVVVTIDQGRGRVALTGTRVVSPIENTTYTLTAENEAGSVDATIQITIEVSNPVIVGDPPKSQIGSHTPPTFNTTSMIFTLNATDNNSGIAEGMFNPVGGFAVSVWGYNEHFGGFYLFGDTTNGNVEEDFSLILGSNDAGQVGRYRLMADVNANNPLRYVDPSKGYYFRIVNQNGEVTFIGAGGEQFISEADVQLNTISFGSDTIGP